MHYTTFLWGRKIYNNRLFFLNLAACDLNKTWQSLVGGNLSLLFVLLVRSTFVRAHVDCNYIKLLVQCFCVALLPRWLTSGQQVLVSAVFGSVSIAPTPLKSLSRTSDQQEATWDAFKCFPSLPNFISTALNNVKREDCVPAALRISPLKSEHKDMVSRQT